MRRTNKVFQQLVAQLLLSCFLLESCSTPNIQIQPKIDKISATHAKPQSVDDSIPIEADTHVVSTKLANNELSTINSATESELSNKNESNQLVSAQENVAVTTRESNVESIATSATSNHTLLNLPQRNYSTTSIGTNNLVRSHSTNRQLNNQHALAVSKTVATSKSSNSPSLNVRQAHNVATLLKGSVCTAQGGYQVSFKEKEEQELQAIVEYKLPTGFTRQVLPVKVEPGFSCSEIAMKSATWQKQHIHVMKEGVYVGGMGLMGGGKDKKGKGKLEGTEEKEEGEDEGEVEAQFQLGQRAYEIWKKEGQKEADYQKALDWLGKAADQDHHGAIALLNEIHQSMPAKKVQFILLHRFDQSKAERRKKQQEDLVIIPPKCSTLIQAFETLRATTPE